MIAGWFDAFLSREKKALFDKSDEKGIAVDLRFQLMYRRSQVGVGETET